MQAFLKTLNFSKCGEYGDNIAYYFVNCLWVKADILAT